MIFHPYFPEASMAIDLRAQPNGWQKRIARAAIAEGAANVQISGEPL